MKTYHLNILFTSTFVLAWLVPWFWGQEVGPRGLKRKGPMATLLSIPPLEGPLVGHIPQTHGLETRAQLLSTLLQGAGTPAPVASVPPTHPCPHCLQVQLGDWGTLGKTQVVWNTLLPGDSLQWGPALDAPPGSWAIGVVAIGPHQAQTPLHILWGDATGKEVVVPLPPGGGNHVVNTPWGWEGGTLVWPSTNPGALVVWGTVPTDGKGTQPPSLSKPTLDLFVILGLPSTSPLASKMAQGAPALGWTQGVSAPLVPPTSAWQGVYSFLKEGLATLQTHRGGGWAVVSHPPSGAPSASMPLVCGGALCLESNSPLQTWQQFSARKRLWPHHALVVEHRHLAPAWDLLAHPALPWHTALLASRVEKVIRASTANEAHGLFLSQTSGQWLPGENQVLWLGRTHSQPPPLEGPISLADFLSLAAGLKTPPKPVAQTLSPTGQQWLTTPQGLLLRSPYGLTEVLESTTPQTLTLRPAVMAFEEKAPPPHHWFILVKPNPGEVGKTLALPLPFLPPETVCVLSHGEPPNGWAPQSAIALPLQWRLGPTPLGLVCTAAQGPTHPLVADARLEGVPLDPQWIGYGEGAVAQEKTWPRPQSLAYVLGPPHWDLALAPNRLVTVWRATPPLVATAVEKGVVNPQPETQP